ncbi:MAG: ATP-binding protein [bacterium]
MEVTSLEDIKQPCDVCERKRYVVISHGDFAHAERCKQCFALCPACEGSGFEYLVDDRGYSYVRKCRVCGPLDKRISAFNAATIPRKYAANSTFDQFRRVDERNRKIGNLPAVHMKLYSFATGFEPGDRGFLLYGDVGTGKTHLLATVIRYLTLEKGYAAKFVEFSHLVSSLRERFDQGQGESGVLGPLIEIPVLAIDELGKGRNTEWQASVIDEIISKRYNLGLTTLFTTNYPVEAAKPTRETADIRRVATLETLRERVGDRINSRLHEMADFVQLEAPDFRKS